MPRIVLKEHDSDKLLEASDSNATIGRDPACALFIEGPSAKVVSARHARIFFQDDAWWIEDSSRNGTILDDERLQQGQRQSIREGQFIGLGESGPRFVIMTLESRLVSETMLEPATGGAAVAKSTTAPRQPAARAAAPASDVRAAPVRKSAPTHAGLKIEESTEPMAPSPDWLVHVIFRATNTNQHFELRAEIVRLGRAPECNIQIPPEQGASVSRVHAEILIHDGGVMLRDAGSRNGTFLNGKRVDVPQTVVRNDLIMLGSGGPTFSIEDLHIVKGPTRTRAASEGDGTPDRGESTPKNARPILGMAASPALSRHTSYRSEPPTAPARSDRPNPDLARNAFDDVPPAGAKRFRVFIWAAVAAIVAAGATVLLRGR